MTWKIRPFVTFAVGLTAAGCIADGAGTRTADRTVASVQAPDGVDIRYEVAGSGEPALVFVHGWSCDRTYWRAQVDHFARSHRVVAIDLGGHGESGLGREDWTMPRFGADVRAVVETLDLPRVVLIGHSMGGPVIAEAARLMPDRVVALLPIDTFHDVDLPMPEDLRDQMLGSMRADFPTATLGFVKQFMFVPGTDSGVVERIARDMAAAPPAVGVSAMEQLLDYDEGAALAGLRAPVRLINADLFPTDLEAARRHNLGLGLTVMPGVGHFLMMEDADEFNRLLERAIRELTGE
jgi:pimeloyl-ACP methyl ester carboxylesterase